MNDRYPDADNPFRYAHQSPIGESAQPGNEGDPGAPNSAGFHKDANGNWVDNLTGQPAKLDANGNPYSSSGKPGGGLAPGVGGSGASTGAATTTTAAGTKSLKWGDIINAALAIYGLHQAQKPPKIYPVPPSPSEQYRLDKTKGLYDFASNYTEQYLKGLGNVNPDFQMPNNLTGNPAFMGGVKAPTIDFSKIPSTNGAPPAAAQNPAASIPPGITPERVRVDPSTGKWVIDGATPQEQAWLDAANQARSGAGGGTPGGGSETYAP